MSRLLYNAGDNTTASCIKREMAIDVRSHLFLKDPTSMTVRLRPLLPQARNNPIASSMVKAVVIASTSPCGSMVM